jgi:hypothetical protein
MSQVVDTTTPGTHSEAFADWLREHGFQANTCFKVELDNKTMTVHQYSLDSSGRKHVLGGKPAIAEPKTVFIKTPLPENVKPRENGGEG